MKADKAYYIRISLESLTLLLIYLVGYFYTHSAAGMAIYRILPGVHWFVGILVFLVFVSVLPLDIARRLRKKARWPVVSDILLAVACIFPFQVFIQSLYTFTHALMCVEPLSSDSTSHILKVVLALISATLIAMAIKVYNKDRLFLALFFVVIYMADVLVVQGAWQVGRFTL